MFAILKQLAENDVAIYGDGVLEILPDGFGFLRSPEANYLPGPDDIYVCPSQVRRFGLRTGDTVEGQIRAPKDGERYFALLKVNTINFDDPEKVRHRINFDNLTPLYPDERLKLEIERPDPQGHHQPRHRPDRAAGQGPARADRRAAAHRQDRDAAEHRPLDRRQPSGSLPDRAADRRAAGGSHRHGAHGEGRGDLLHLRRAGHRATCRSTEMVIEKAKRLVEHKRDVVILLDSITRLARAYNTVVPSSGKVLTGGVDANALQRPKRFFGAARNIEEGGSLTIIATALIDTGSRMDEVIFEEFKGTGNSEIILDRKLSDKRTFPSIDITKSGTRKEELLVDKATLVEDVGAAPHPDADGRHRRDGVPARQAEAHARPTTTSSSR